MAAPPAGPLGVAVDAAAEAGPRYCTRHPDRETLVSCGRCGRPFCPECLIHTPAGQRCYECAGVRRHAGQQALATRVVQAILVVVAGSAVGAFFGGSIIYALIIAAVTGSFSGQILSPVVNRHNRRYMLPVSGAILLLGALVGWTLPVLLRSFTLAAGSGVPVLLILATVPFALLQTPQFWIFVGVTAVLAYQRVR